MSRQGLECSRKMMEMEKRWENERMERASGVYQNMNKRTWKTRAIEETDRMMRMEERWKQEKFEKMYGR